jgi:hypothetical protein
MYIQVMGTNFINIFTVPRHIGPIQKDPSMLPMVRRILLAIIGLDTLSSLNYYLIYKDSVLMGCYALFTSYCSVELCRTVQCSSHGIYWAFGRIQSLRVRRLHCSRSVDRLDGTL